MAIFIIYCSAVLAMEAVILLAVVTGIGVVLRKLKKKDDKMDKMDSSRPSGRIPGSV